MLFENMLSSTKNRTRMGSQSMLCLMAVGIMTSPCSADNLVIKIGETKDTLSVYRQGSDKPIVTQHARENHRPYLHPILAPDGNGVLTEYSPGHHKHQTGLYWGFTRVNGRDYFHHPADNYWKRTSLSIVKATGQVVSWNTKYDLLDAAGKAVLSESQTWEMRATAKQVLLSLNWQGTGVVDVTIGQYAYGGMFLRMPWKRGLQGDAQNSAGFVNAKAEGKRDIWVDVGMEIAGRKDQGHIAIFDHPKNKSFPLPWRVDGQLGIGPVRARLGDWKIKKGTTETIRHQLVIYTGKRDPAYLNKLWSEYTGLDKPPALSKDAITIPTKKAQPNPMVLVVKTLKDSKNAEIQKALLTGLVKGLAGRRQVAAPAGWAAAKTKLDTSDDKTVRELAGQLAQIFGDKDAAAQSLSKVRDTKAPVGERRLALRRLLSQQNLQASYLLESLLDEPAMAIEAIRGYSTVENATAPIVLLARFRRMNAEERRAVVETLATRKRYAMALLDAVKHDQVPKEEIPAHVHRSLGNILGKQVEPVLGKAKQVAVDRVKAIARYKSLLTEAALKKADASRGRAVFKKTCASCHVLYGEGAKIGPDLTGSNRANLDYFLLNSVDPSYDVPNAYKMVTIITNDGRVVSGIVAEEDATRIVLKTVEQPTVTIAKEDIDVRKISPKSMMPDGQLDKMKPQQVIDLYKYLRTTAQVEIAQ